MKKLPTLIGVVHLPPLVGAPLAQKVDPVEILQQAGLRAVTEAKALEKAGFHAVILENFGDTPFYKDKVPLETVSSLSVIAAAVRESIKLPVGINVLRNDAMSALTIASVTGCDFIRVNVLSGVAATDQGWIEGNAAELLRERERLNSSVKIFADVCVKHAKMVSTDNVEVAIEEVAGRSLADAVIITGETTGRSVDMEQLKLASEVSSRHGVPLFIGSGAQPSTVSQLKKYASGVIVGSSLRKKGIAGEPLDAKRMKAFVSAFKAKSISVKKKKKKKTKRKS